MSSALKYRMDGRRLFAALALLCALFLLVLLPGASRAWAAGEGEGQASSGGYVVEISDETVAAALENVEVSAEADAALEDGCDYGLTGFFRSQAGSNRAVDGTYCGYNYYMGKEPGALTVVSTGDYAVIYVPSAAAEQYGINISQEADCEQLSSYLIALDTVNAKGSSRLNAVKTWYFTDETTYDVGLARYKFDCELTEGRYYTCVIGTDGGDITAQSHEGYLILQFADFAFLTDADDVVITKAATGLAWLVEFLSGVDYSPLWVTLKTTGTAIVFIFVLGLAAAYLTMRVSPRWQDILDSVLTIPMVLPPTVCGFLLLLLCGNNTAFGRWFIDVGFPLIFSWPATVIAAVIVALPLMYRSARGAFEGIDPNMLNAARTLGWSEVRIFFSLMLPLAWSSIAAGTVLAFARALGEFGATLFMAGNYLGVTRTIPIAIYFEWMNGNTDVAIFWTIIIMLFSFLVILFINLWSRRTTRYRRGADEA